MIFIKEVNLAFGHKKVFEEISETIGTRDRIALVGSNGFFKNPTEVTTSTDHLFSLCRLIIHWKLFGDIPFLFDLYLS